MLRITVHEEPRSVTFQLEGRLAGAGCRSLRNAGSGLRRRSKADRPCRPSGSDLRRRRGPGLPGGLHHQGAELVAADCLTKAIVDEIARLVDWSQNTLKPKQRAM